MASKQVAMHSPEQRKKAAERVEREQLETKTKIRATAERLLARLKASGQMAQNVTVDDLLRETEDAGF